MCARRFLIVIFVLTLLTVVGAFALFQFGGSLLKRQALPTVPFEAPPAASGPDYVRVENWLHLPDAVPPGPAEWRPKGLGAEPTGGSRAATFYIHPTTYLERDRWNASVSHRESQDRAALFVRTQASAFNFTRVYAPKYRQAAFGAFLDRGENAVAALDLAYGDIARAFDRFLAQEAEAPIILAGHSQGALHLTRLLKEKIAGNPALRSRIVAAYVVGWPVSRLADLPAMGLAACDNNLDTRCVLSWQSFGVPSNPSLITDYYDGSVGLTGQKRERKDMLCSNPLTGFDDFMVPGEITNWTLNSGTLVPSEPSLREGSLVQGAVGALCREGFLEIAGPGGKLPELGPYVLPGNNYHVYDFALFWANIRADARGRLNAFRP